MRRCTLCSLLLGFLVVGFGSGAAAQQTPTSTAPQTPIAPQRAEIAPGDKIEPAALAKAIQESASPLVLQIGPRSLYDQAHILNAEYAGAAGTEAGLEMLRTHLKETAKERWIVLYCGCCPWDRCPNIRPAYSELQALGFTHVQVLYLPTSFGADWVDKGYPTEH